MAVNLSDIAAMGGRPVAAFVSVGLPQENAEAVAEELYLGLREVADRFDTAIAGGDTNTWGGGLVINVTVLGEPGPQGRSCAAARNQATGCSSPARSAAASSANTSTSRRASRKG